MNGSPKEGPNGAIHDTLVPMLRRFAPPVARGLALGFAVLAIATLVFGMGEHATAADRYWISGLYGLIAAVSFAVSRAVEPLLRKLTGGPIDSGPA